MATHSSILTWEIPWTEETYGPQRVHRVTKSQDTTWMTLQLQQHLLLLLLLSHFSRVWLCATPQTAAQQAPCPWDSPGKNTGVGCRFLLQCMKMKSESEVAQSCPTLSDPMDCSLPGFSIHGIFQARVLEWGTIAFSEQQQQYYLYDWLNLKRYLLHLSRKPLNQNFRLSISKVKYSLGLDRVRLYKELPNNYFTRVWDECTLVK